MKEGETKRHLIIGGTFKSGTSSLYTYLNQHSQIHGSSIKETGFFVPARYGRPTDDISNYFEYFKGADQNDWLLEASPGYLYGGSRIIEAISTSLGENVRMIFMFRNPTDRFISFYKMLKDENVKNVSSLVSDENLSLEAYFERCRNYSPDPNNIDESEDFILNGLKDSCYAEYLDQWYKLIPEKNIKIVFFDELGDQPDRICRDICDWIGIDTSEVDEFNYRKVNQYRSHRSGFVKRIALYINYRFEAFFRRNEKLKRKLVGIYEKINGGRKNESDINYEVRQRIDDYYRDYNLNLNKLLTKKGYKNLPDWLK